MNITDLAMMKAIAGGIETIELTTTVGQGSADFTTEENAILTEAWKKGKPVIIKCPLDLGTIKLSCFAGLAMRGLAHGDFGAAIFAFSFGSNVVQLISLATDGVPSGVWIQSTQKV